MTSRRGAASPRDDASVGVALALIDAHPASEEKASRRYLEYLRDESDPYALD